MPDAPFPVHRSRPPRVWRRGVGLLLGALFALVAVGASAQGLVAPRGIAPGDRVIDLAPHLDVLEDPSGQLTVVDVESGAAAAGFRPLGPSAATFGFSDSAFWLRARLHNTGPEPRELVLRLSYALLDHVEVHLLSDGRTRASWATGDRLPFASRPVPHRDFLFPFTMAPGENLSLLVRAHSEGPVNVPLVLYDEARLVGALGSEQLALGALFGSFALLALCTAVLYGFVRDEAFAYYVAYVLAYGGYMGVFNGLAYQYVWPGNPELASVAQVVMLMLALHFLLLFSRSLLRVRGLSPRLDRLHQLLQAAIFGLMVISPFVSYGAIVKPISYAVGASILMVVAIGVTGYRAGQAAAGYFLLAWSVFLLGVLAYLLKVFAVLPHNVLTQYGFQLGTIFEFVLLSMALGIRVKEIRQESRTDSLTGLANRTRFDEIIEEGFAQARGTGGPLSLVLLDVDHFKRVNDTHGHAVGDRVLETVAEALRRSVPPPYEPCRYGGEEFAVVLPRCELETAVALAETLRRAIAGASREIPVTVSVGVACTAGQSFADPRGLFRAADEALYAAKSTGRDKVVAWNRGRAETTETRGVASVMREPAPG